MWQLRTQALNFSNGTLLMGIVNATPDSFSDGGKYLDLGRAVEHGLRLAAEGAAILDIGGESTRPYSHSVSETEELRRVIPVIERLVDQCSIPISIDTSKPQVAAEAIAAGAEIINDVRGMEHPEMIAVACETGAAVCGMHMQGTPQTMQDHPQYNNVVDDILKYLKERKLALLRAGIEAEKICLDPGVGFGKTHEHNLALVRQAGRFLELGSPILIGHSRKGFIGKLLGDKELDRDAGTLAISLMLAQQEIPILRVHEVARTFQALRVDFGMRRTD